MCLIIANPNATEIPDELILNAYGNNSDGFGIMWAKNGFLRLRRGLLTPAQILEVFKTFHERKMPYVAHFRYTTHGLTNAQNCHPFPITTRKGGIAMMHNGTLVGEDWDRAKKSDTYVFSERITKHLEDKDFAPSDLFVKDIPVLAERYSNAITTDKLVFMNGKGEINIYNEDNGLWIDDIWFSNLYSLYQAKTNILSWCRGNTDRERVSNEELVKLVAE